MSRVTLSLAAGAMMAAGSPWVESLEAQKPSNNMWTRSAALYISRARENPDPEDKKGLYQQALEVSLEGIQNDPGNPRGYFMAGQANIFLGNYVAADSMWDRAEMIFPNYTEETERERQNAWINAYNRAVNSLQAGQLDAALEDLHKADVIYQGRPEAKMNLGAVYARQGEMEKAVDAYRGGLEIVRGPLFEKQPEQRQEIWRENEQIAAFNLAQILANLGRDEEAAQAYRDFLERRPEDTTAKINLAVVLTRLGETEEASTLYQELLTMEGLDADDYFRTGLGLFSANRHEDAAAAFEQALEKNPYMRDALYNLGQTLYQRSRALEEARMNAPEAEKAALAAQLVDVYTAMVDVMGRFTEMHPHHKNALIIKATAHRGLSDVAASEGEGEPHRNAALATLEAGEALPFEVLNVQMQSGDGSATLRGRVKNWTLEQGQPVTLRFQLVDESGTAISSEEVTVTAAGAEQETPFEVTIEAPGEVFGWTYEVVS